MRRVIYPAFLLFSVLLIFSDLEDRSKGSYSSINIGKKYSRDQILQDVFPTPIATPTPSTIFIRTPTSTLAPFPSITMEFPIQTAAHNLLKIQQPDDSSTMDKQESRFDFGNARICFSIGIILMLWIIIGGWFYYSQRKLEE